MKKDAMKQAASTNGESIIKNLIVASVGAGMPALLARSARKTGASMTQITKSLAFCVPNLKRSGSIMLIIRMATPTNAYKVSQVSKLSLFVTTEIIMQVRSPAKDSVTERRYLHRTSCCFEMGSASA